MHRVFLFKISGGWKGSLSAVGLLLAALSPSLAPGLLGKWENAKKACANICVGISAMLLCFC